MDLLVMPFLVLLAAWHLLALHTWISLRFESVVACLGVVSPFRGGAEEIWWRLAAFSMLAVMLAIVGGWNVCRREVR